LVDHAVLDIAIYSSDALRAERTRDFAVDRLTSPVGIVALTEPDTRLRELGKGDLEGVLRSSAYPTPEIKDLQKNDWHFRHGTPESGGQTAYEAGSRWLEWQAEVAQQAAQSKACVLAFGHNLVTSFGVWRLTHPRQTALEPLPSLQESAPYKVANGTALVLDERDGAWQVIDRIVPTATDFEGL
jgi:broad specificity phosphatase PhoE